MRNSRLVLDVVSKKSFGAATQYFTGSKQHNVLLREIAVKAKLKLNEYGLFKADKMIAGHVEEEIYQKLGLDYVEPLLREDRGEIDAAKTHSLPGQPAKLFWEKPKHCLRTLSLTAKD